MKTLNPKLTTLKLAGCIAAVLTVLQRCQGLLLGLILLCLAPNALATIVDDSFGDPSLDGLVKHMAIQSDGKAIIVGRFTEVDGTERNRVARFNTDGTLDTTFKYRGGANNWGRAVALQHDGKIIIAGWFTEYNGYARNKIARLNTDGSLDESFNPTEIAAEGYIHSIDIQADGKIVIGGDFSKSSASSVDIHLARLHTDGTFDDSFNTGTGPDQQVYSVKIQSGGTIIIGGVFSEYDGTESVRLARINTDGTLDASFNASVEVGGGIYDTVTQPDGKILIAGFFTSYQGLSRNRIARIHSDGSLDLDFNSGTGSGAQINEMAIQDDGKIVIVGWFTGYDDVGRNRIARLNTDGSLDLSFDPGTGGNYSARTVVIEASGKILVGGEFTTIDDVQRRGMVRLHHDIDAVNDIAINVKVYLEGAIVKQSNGPVTVAIDEMTNTLATILPTSDPYTYNGGTQNLGGSTTEDILQSSDNKIVDWVYLEIRSVDTTTVLRRFPALLRTDGQVVAMNGTSLPVTPRDGLLDENVYVVVHHRNHLPVMTPNPLPIDSGALTHNFWQSNSYNGACWGQKSMNADDSGWVMFGGDSVISFGSYYDINGDDKSAWLLENGIFGEYLKTDFNMDRDVSGGDKIIWNENNGVFSCVPFVLNDGPQLFAPQEEEQSVGPKKPLSGRPLSSKPLSSMSLRN